MNDEIFINKNCFYRCSGEYMEAGSHFILITDISTMLPNCLIEDNRKLQLDSIGSLINTCKYV